MPFYPKLKVLPWDSVVKKNKKKRVVRKLKVLRAALKDHINTSTDATNSAKTVKIATWNLREYGKKNYGGRSFEEQYYIAEIVSKFDLIALQEIRADLTEFNELMKTLGPQWDFIATDVTDGWAGNNERMVFLFNRVVVQFKNIAGELTLKENAKIRASFGERVKLEDGLQLELPPGLDLSGTYRAATKTTSGKIRLREDLEIPLPDDCKLAVPSGSFLTLKKGTEIIRPQSGQAQVTIPANLVEGENYALRFPENSFDDSLRQFARTPFLISFQLGWLKLNLCTVHIYYGDDTNENKLEQRRKEIELLAQALGSKAEKEFKDDRESFLGLLGDFNIVGKDHPTMDALVDNDFVIPEQLQSIPGSNVKRDKAYDQIAFWMPSNRSTRYSKIEVTGANIFDFFEHVYTPAEEQEYKAEGADVNGLKANTNFERWRTYKMSDHLPMWVEIRNDFSAEYLEYLESINE